MQHPFDDEDALTARVEPVGASSEKNIKDHPISPDMTAPHQVTEH
jgi:hypothetical protein